MGGVQREEECDHRGTAQVASDGEEQKEEQDGIYDVQADIGFVVTGGISAVEGPVDHVGDPGERVPIALLKSRECPGYALRGHALLYMRVFRDIVVVVHGEEIIVAYALVGESGGQREENTDGGDLPGLVGWGGDGSGFAGRRALGLRFALAGFACHGRQSPLI